MTLGPRVWIPPWRGHKLWMKMSYFLMKISSDKSTHIILLLLYSSWQRTRHLYEVIGSECCYSVAPSTKARPGGHQWICYEKLLNVLKMLKYDTAWLCDVSVKVVVRLIKSALRQPGRIFTANSSKEFTNWADRMRSHCMHRAYVSCVRNSSKDKHASFLLDPHLGDGWISRLPANGSPKMNRKLDTRPLCGEGSKSKT